MQEKESIPTTIPSGGGTIPTWCRAGHPQLLRPHLAPWGLGVGHGPVHQGVPLQARAIVLELKAAGTQHRLHDALAQLVSVFEDGDGHLRLALALGDCGIRLTAHADALQRGSHELLG